VNAPSTGSPPRPKVLVVDDYLENLIATAAVLRDVDAEIVQARSGNEALSLMLRSEFAVVLLDVQMPDMDGFEVASLMRSAQHSQHVPIIFLTAFGEQRMHVARGYESGAVDFLFKPLDAEILKSKVEVFLRLYRQSRALGVMAELQRTQQELERVNADLEGFICAASHDLREPVRTLHLTLDLLDAKLCTDLDDEGQSYLRVLRERAQRILSLLAALAEYSVDSFTPVHIDLAEIVETVTADLSEAIRETGAVVEPGKLHSVDGHPSALRSLFRYLMLHALKRRLPGTPLRICVESMPMGAEDAAGEGLDPKERYLVVWVRDNGEGVCEGDEGRLFGAFAYLRNGERSDSTDLSLAVCRRIVERHRGRIGAQGSRSGGTWVRVVLPLRQREPS